MILIHQVYRTVDLPFFSSLYGVNTFQTSNLDSLSCDAVGP